MRIKEKGRFLPSYFTNAAIAYSRFLVILCLWTHFKDHIIFYNIIFILSYRISLLYKIFKFLILYGKLRKVPCLDIITCIILVNVSYVLFLLVHFSVIYVTTGIFLYILLPEFFCTWLKYLIEYSVTYVVMQWCSMSYSTNYH